MQHPLQEARPTGHPSDFWTDLAEFLDGLGQFQHRKFEILLLHVLDPDELNLPSAQAARFQDLETREEVQVESEEVRSAYRAPGAGAVGRWWPKPTTAASSTPWSTPNSRTLEAIEAYLGFRGRS